MMLEMGRRCRPAVGRASPWVLAAGAAGSLSGNGFGVAGEVFEGSDEIVGSRPAGGDAQISWAGLPTTP